MPEVVSLVQSQAVGAFAPHSFGRYNHRPLNMGRRTRTANPAKPQEPALPPAPSGRGSVWILDPWRDVALIVATPVILLPAIWLAEDRFRPDQIYLFVASFGALGHHLPGMMRAYGDRFLFERFKYRFVLTPLLLGGTCLLFAVRQLNAIVLVAYLWGVWHGLMQTYGFLRIYDAKVGSVSRLTARLDSAMCVTWFGAAVLLAPTRMTKILTDYYQAGGAVVSPAIVGVLTGVWLIATGLVTLGFVGHLLYDRARGNAQSPAKLVLLAISIAFWWYSNVAVSNMLVGIALFEIFHDVQYLTIVWIFNLNRVDRNPGVGRFTRFLFRRSWGLAGLYVGLVAAYGSLNLIPPGLSSQTLSRSLMGVLTASALLHFYYDGFIWKVREPAVRESLGLGAQRARPIEPSGPSGWAHGLKWAAFILPVAWLGSAETRGPMLALERDRMIVQAVPHSAEARNKLGGALLLRGQVDEAIEHLQEAVRLDPKHAGAHSNLGVALARLGWLAEAIDHDREALRLDPRQTQAYSNLGNVLLQQGQVREAIARFNEGLSIDPADPQARTNLAGALLQEGRIDEAISELEQVLRVTPDFQPARRNLEILLHQRQREQ
ncbi:MAG: tetratricopeptide repeat protein [Acidobacteria bacterium]|nr:tetratricopeptide repeat protein [Acidobacteriota bacterium]